MCIALNKNNILKLNKLGTIKKITSPSASLFSITQRLQNAIIDPL